MWYIFLLFLPFVFADISHKPTPGGTHIEVLGQSGKVKVSRADVQIMTMTFDRMYEISSDLRRNTNINFPTQDFFFTDIKRNTTYQNVSVDEFTFSSHLKTPNEITLGKLEIRSMLIEQDGTMKTSAESWDVSKGDIKWNIKLSEWNWDTDVDALELLLNIKGAKSFGNSSSMTHDLGGGTLQLSQRVEVDGVDASMPVGYPRVESRGVKDIYVFRFPKFNHTLVYDPVLQMDTTEPTETTGAANRADVSIWVALVSLVMVYKDTLQSLRS